jgi:hypothetical protein
MEAQRKTLTEKSKRKIHSTYTQPLTYSARKGVLVRLAVISLVEQPSVAAIPQ